MTSRTKTLIAPGPRDGFSLLELLVALAVFSVAAMALLNLAGEGVRSQAHMESRTLGGVVADNLAVAAIVDPAPPALGESNGTATLAGRDWRWTRTVAATDDPDLNRIDIRVADEDRTVALLTAYRSRS